MGRPGLANGTTRVERVLVYFNNDLGGHAIRNARKLKELLAVARVALNRGAAAMRR